MKGDEQDPEIWHQLYSKERVCVSAGGTWGGRHMKGDQVRNAGRGTSDA